LAFSPETLGMLAFCDSATFQTRHFAKKSAI